MPRPSDITNKIDRLANIAITDYEIDIDFMSDIVKRAKLINERAEDAGFSSTDAFMGEDGTLAITCYFLNKSVGVSILPNGYEVYSEKNQELIDFEVYQTEHQVFAYLDSWGRLWNSSEFYQGTHTIQTGILAGSTPLHFGEVGQAESLLLKQVALP